MNIRVTLFVWMLLATVAQAADPVFVGVLSIALEPSVATQLRLADNVRAGLAEIAEKRESDALELALSLKDLSTEERAAKLAPFVAESERLGLQLLTAEQRTKLEQIRLSRQGFAALTEPTVAQRMELTEEQQSALAKLQNDFKEKISTGPEEQRRQARIQLEQELAKRLSADQRARWDRLTGRVEEESVALNDVGETKVAAEQPSAKVAVEPAKVVAKPTTSPMPNGPADSAKLKFNFRFTPWKDVLDWFSQQADLSLVMDAPPTGTFNYTDNRSYTPAEAIDLLNSVLLTKGYTLLRRGRMLLVVNLEDGIPPNLVPQVGPEDLDAKGEYELVSSLFPLGKFAPEDAEKEIRPMLGPQGALLVMPKAKQIYVTETAGKLRTIRALLRTVSEADSDRDDKIASFRMKHIAPSEFMIVARPLVGIPENLNTTPDGSLRISLDELNGRILVTGKPERVQKISDLLTILDVPPENDSGPATMVETPQLEVYPVATADPDGVLQVLRTLLAGLPDVRLDKDAKTGHIVALARPSQHATIRATLDQMQKDGRLMEVVKLRKLDPQTAVIAVNKLFGGTGDEASPTGPKVDADPNTMQLLVRGSQAQIEQIRELLVKMGETSIEENGIASERSHVRTIPLTGRAATSALEQVQSLWPTLHPNKIRAVTPNRSSSSSSRVPLPPPGADVEFETSPRSRPNPSEKTAPSSPTSLEKSASDRRDLSPFVALSLRDRNHSLNSIHPNHSAKASRNNHSSTVVANASSPQKFVALSLRDRNHSLNSIHHNHSANASRDNHFSTVAANASSPPKFVALSLRDRNHSLNSSHHNHPANASHYTNNLTSWHFVALKEEDNATKPASATPNTVVEKPSTKEKSVPGAEIVVTVGPAGLVIASEDLDALDDFETLLSQVASQTAASGKEFTVFYLKFAKAESAVELLQAAMGGGGGDSEGGGGSLMGDLASSFLGGQGGMLGSLMGMGGGGGGGGTSRGPVLMTPDSRLNAILCHGRPTDLDLVEQLLKVIDQESSPEDVQTVARPRFIAVKNTSAEEVAAVVKQIYANRMTVDATQQRQPSPEEFIRALRGGRGGNTNTKKGEEQKLTLGVDKRSNSIIVSAPDPLFEEVKALVEHLDIAGGATDEAVRVVSLKGANPALVERALNSLVGNSATVTRQGSSSGGAGPGNPRPQPTAGASTGESFQPSPERMQEEVRRRVEMFNSLQQEFNRNRGGAPGGGGGPPGGGRGRN